MENQLSHDEIQMIELMRRFDLRYEELQLLLAKGIKPASEALKAYRQPPWTKEDVAPMDNYYNLLEDKYSNLQRFLNNGNLI